MMKNERIYEEAVKRDGEEGRDHRLSRRSLVKFAAGSLAAGSVAGSLKAVAAAAPAEAGAPAAVDVVPTSGLEGSLYYTESNPGRWHKKIKGHLPVLSAKRDESGLTVTVVTAHEMKGFEHYIVKHILLDKYYNVLGEKMFDPTKEFTPKSAFVFSGAAYSGTLYAVSVCNKHDAWLNSIEV